jgi:hypothetical protein
MTAVPMPAPSSRPLVRWGVVAWLLVSIGLLAATGLARDVPLWLAVVVLANWLASFLAALAAGRRLEMFRGKR